MLIEEKAWISDIQRFCIQDGPGIRTTVFFMGCNLSCNWCQNPETRISGRQLMFDKSKCIYCYNCIDVCTEKCINKKPLSIKINRFKCSVCGKCAEICLTKALEICGKLYSVKEVFKEVFRDEVFYKKSTGGVTLSGGEPMLRPLFCAELLKMCRERGINTVMETAGCVSWSAFELILDYVDLFLYDLKTLNNNEHKLKIGVENTLILENIKKLSNLNKNIIARIPLITGFNDNLKSFRKILNFIKNNTNIEIIHLLPFHQLGSSKYELLGLDYEMQAVKELDNFGQFIIEGEKKGFKIDVGGYYYNNFKINSKKKNIFFIKEILK